MSKNEIKDKKYPEPMVTESNRTVRKKNPGFVNPNRGIEVSPGLNLQDVPREMIMNHMRKTEEFWKNKFNSKYGNRMGGHQTF